MFILKEKQWGAELIVYVGQTYEACRDWYNKRSKWGVSYALEQWDGDKLINREEMKWKVLI